MYVLAAMRDPSRAWIDEFALSGGAFLLLPLSDAAPTALCLARPRHYERATRRSATASVAWTLRTLGWLLLAAGGMRAISSLGWAIGLVAWTGALSISALSLVLAIWPWASRLAIRLVIVAAVTSALLP